MGILSQLILQRIPFDVEVRRLTEPYYRKLGLAFLDRKRLSPVCLKFLEYLRYREE